MGLKIATAAGLALDRRCFFGRFLDRPAAVDELRVGRQRRNQGALMGEAWFTWFGQRRRPSIEPHVDELHAAIAAELARCAGR